MYIYVYIYTHTLASDGWLLNQHIAAASVFLQPQMLKNQLCHTITDSHSEILSNTCQAETARTSANWGRFFFRPSALLQKTRPSRRKLHFFFARNMLLLVSTQCAKITKTACAR